MMIRNPLEFALFVSCSGIVLSACDTGETVVSSKDAIAAAAEIEAEVMDAELMFDWDDVAMPALPGVEPAFNPNQAASPVKQWFTVESFYFSSDSNFLSLTQMAGGLFTPLPIGMPTLPPELEDGFLLGFTFYDHEGDIVGFGTEQEVLDIDEATGETVYALTIPGRGSLMLSQEEEFSYMFAELDDMVADQEFVREFDPPLVNIHTVPGSARIIGGTGEFANAKGFWREISIVNKFDLVTGLHEVGIILQIVHF